MTSNLWKKIIPPDETSAAAQFLVKIWKDIVRIHPNQLNYQLREPELTEKLSFYLNVFKSESGLTGFWINEDQKTCFDKQGKVVSRVKMDITYFSNSGACTIELVFEFKKLSESSSLTTYCGKQGMRRFVDGDYALRQPLAIMVGLLEGKGSGNVIVNDLCKYLSKGRVVSSLQMVSGNNNQYIHRPSIALKSAAEFDTEHLRLAIKSPPNSNITISHIFLTC